MISLLLTFDTSTSFILILF